MTSIKKVARMSFETTVISTRLSLTILSAIYGVAASMVKNGMAKQIKVRKSGVNPVSLSGKCIDGRVVDTCPCDRRCTHATGHSCECSCGGANHGKDYDC